MWVQLCREIEKTKKLPEKYRMQIREEEKLMALLMQARDSHRSVCYDHGGPFRP